MINTLHLVHVWKQYMQIKKYHANIHHTINQRIIVPSSFSIPCTKSKISLPPSMPPLSPVDLFSSAQISWNLILQSLVAITRHPSSFVLDHQVPPFRIGAHVSSNPFLCKIIVYTGTYSKIFVSGTCSE